MRMVREPLPEPMRKQRCPPSSNCRMTTPSTSTHSESYRPVLSISRETGIAGGGFVLPRRCDLSTRTIQARKVAQLPKAGSQSNLIGKTTRTQWKCRFSPPNFCVLNRTGRPDHFQGCLVQFLHCKRLVQKHRSRRQCSWILLHQQ